MKRERSIPVCAAAILLTGFLKMVAFTLPAHSMQPDTQQVRAQQASAQGGGLPSVNAEAGPQPEADRHPSSESGSLPVRPVPDAAMLEGFEEIGTVNSLMIESDGELLLEYYLGGMTSDKAVNTKSASKSIISLLTGIAIDKGFLKGVDQTVGELLPAWFEANPDPVKTSITIGDLLTMRSGLETTSYYNYGPWVTSADWVAFVLSRPLRDEPGGQMIYSTGTSHLLSAILTEAAGMSTLEFAQRYLFTPLGIEPGFWEQDPKGYYMGGNNLYLSPHALLKIGRLVMNEGVYEGERIVSGEWIEQSLQVHTRSNWNLYDYGYMWWVKPAGEYEVYYAWGYGGQFILLIPGLDSVIAVTSDAERNDGTREYEKVLFRWLEEQVIPWLEASAAPGRS